jgi:hypothetical protein
VSNFDIAATVLEFFGIDTPVEMSGRPLTAGTSESDLEGLEHLRDKAMAASNSRKTMVRFYVISVIIILFLFLLVILIREDLVWNHQFFWTLILLAILAGPLAYLLVPLFGNPYLYKSIPIAVLGSLLLGFAALMSRGRGGKLSGEYGGGTASPVIRPMLLLSGATLLLVLLDPLLGSPLMTFSAFGSDVMLGDRYYGIGNLYMGIAIGSALLFACLATDGLKGYLDFLGSPRIGANVGGLITAAAAFSFTLIKLNGKRFGWKGVVTLAVVLVLCVTGLLLADALLPGSASHAGRLVSRVEGEGISALMSQIGRKVSANWSLAFASNWRLLLLLTIISGLILNRRYGMFRRVTDEYPSLGAGFSGMAVGLVIALLLNDSGIEPAAILSVFLFVPYFLLLIPWTVKPRSQPMEDG